MKVSSVNSSGSAPPVAGAVTVADGAGVSAATEVAASEVAAGADVMGVSSAGALVAAGAEEAAAEEAAVGTAGVVSLEAPEPEEGAGVVLPEPPQDATGPPGAV